jgi:hypothetical protein
MRIVSPMPCCSRTASAAVGEELSAEQRRRANDLMTKHPWGTRQPG